MEDGGIGTVGVVCRTAGYRDDDFTDEGEKEALEEVQLSQEKVVLSRPRYVRVELGALALGGMWRDGRSSL